MKKFVSAPLPFQGRRRASGSLIAKRRTPSGPILVNSYPTYFEKLPRLIERINREKRNSKWCAVGSADNYVLFLGETNVETWSAPRA